MIPVLSAWLVALCIGLVVAVYARRHRPAKISIADCVDKSERQRLEFREELRAMRGRK